MVDVIYEVRAMLRTFQNLSLCCVSIDANGMTDGLAKKRADLLVCCSFVLPVCFLFWRWGLLFLPLFSAVLFLSLFRGSVGFAVSKKVTVK
ncbi:hypothetical protein QYF36_022978 [Acer negundo]|nr:hypothetical protein QYF36_022978 [Acer negundo]